MSKAKKLQAVVERSAGVVDTGVKSPVPAMGDGDIVAECVVIMADTLGAIERLPAVRAAAAGASEAQKLAVKRDRKARQWKLDGLFVQGGNRLYVLANAATLDTDGRASFSPDRGGCHLTLTNGRKKWYRLSDLADAMRTKGKESILGAVASAD